MLNKPRALQVFKNSCFWLFFPPPMYDTPTSIMPHVGPYSGKAHGLGHNPRPKSLVTSTTLIWKNFGGKGEGRGGEGEINYPPLWLFSSLMVVASTHC